MNIQRILRHVPNWFRGLILIIGVSSSLCASMFPPEEYAREEQKEFVSRAYDSDLVSYLDHVGKVTLPDLLFDLLSQLVQSHRFVAVSERATIETKVDWLLDLISDEMVTEQIKHEWEWLGRGCTIKCFLDRLNHLGIKPDSVPQKKRTMPPDISKGPKKNRGFAPPKRRHRRVHPFKEAFATNDIARFAVLLADPRVGFERVFSRLTSLYAKNSPKCPLLSEKLAICSNEARIHWVASALSDKALGFYIKALKKRPVWPAQYTAFVDMLKKDPRAAAYMPPKSPLPNPAFSGNSDTDEMKSERSEEKGLFTWKRFLYAASAFAALYTFMRWRAAVAQDSSVLVNTDGQAQGSVEVAA